MKQNPSLEDVKQRRSILAESIKDIQAEISRLDALIDGLEKFAAGSSKSAAAPAQVINQGESRYEAVVVNTRAPTTRDLIVSYLTTTTNLWRTSEDIKRNVSDMKGADVPMGTIGPTLSNMKNEGVVVRDGLKIGLTSRVKAEEPDFFTENGEVEASPEAEGAATPSNESRSSAQAPIFD